MLDIGPRRAAPGPSDFLVFEHLRRFRKAPLDVLSDWARRYGDVVAFRLGPRRAHLLSRPDDIERVLLDVRGRYSKRTLAWSKIRRVLGKGLLTSEGDLWRRQRRIAQPAFHRQKVAGFGEIMTRAARSTVERLAPLIDAGRAVDVCAEMTRLTLAIVGRTLLGVELDAETDELGRAVSLILKQTLERIGDPLLDLPAYLPTPRNRLYRRAQETLDRAVLGMIHERRQGGGDRPDLLSLLMQARDEETGERMSDAQLRDEVMTTLMAGHETVASALSWTWHLLGAHPDCEARMRGELAAVLNGRPPTVDDLPRLSYTLMVIKEAIRLYPPVWMFTRMVEEDDHVGGFELRRGTVVFMSPYVTHRHSALWERPDVFDPERFAPEKEASRARFAYFPFGGGPRQCIGGAFALMEAHLVLATLSQACRMRPVLGRVVEPDAAITLRPRGGLWMTVQG